jgi:hypothetical protein
MKFLYYDGLRCASQFEIVIKILTIEETEDAQRQSRRKRRIMPGGEIPVAAEDFLPDQPKPM